MMLAESGASIVLTGTNPEHAQAAAAAVGKNAVGLELDLRDFDRVGEFISGIAAQRGRIDALVVSAGVMEQSVIGMIKKEDVRQTLDVNIGGAVAAVQAASRAMRRKHRGSIVLMSSIVAGTGSVGQCVYAASKAAVASLTRSAARELGGAGIRVNAVAPGVIDTDLIQGLSQDVLASSVKATPLGRLGTAEDVAAAVHFLISDASWFITGQILGVDGGLAV